MTTVAIVYYSATGTVDAMARRLAATATQQGAEVPLRHVAETAPEEAVQSRLEWVEHRHHVEHEPVATTDDLDWADVVLLGSPTRYGSAAGQLQAFLDTTGSLWQEGRLADKVYAAFTASQTAHGGQETTLLSLHTTVYHWGGIVVAPGYTEPVKVTDGNPYGVGKVTGATTHLDDGDHEALDHLVRRVLQVSRKLTA